jgi:intein/homing endonuclease
MNYEIVEIDSIEEIGEFDNDYVYDLEMEDESHTFITNNILIHNTDSIFVGFEPAIKSSQWKNNVFNEGWLNRCPHPYRIIRSEELEINIDNPNYKGTIIFDDIDMSIDENIIEELPDDFKILIIEFTQKLQIE